MRLAVGKTIRYATRHDKIQAASCQGNPDCTDSDSVDLVITIVPAPEQRVYSRRR